MKKLNYFESKEECKVFLDKFNFQYSIPNLTNDFECYYIELNDNLDSIRFCALFNPDGVGYTAAYSCFYDSEREKDFFCNLMNVYTFDEAAKLWGLSDGAVLRTYVKRGKFNEGEYRKSGNTWLISKSAMERLYGKR